MTTPISSSFSQNIGDISTPTPTSEKYSLSAGEREIAAFCLGRSLSPPPKPITSKNINILVDNSPLLDNNLSLQKLKQTYFALGNDKWKECIDGCFHHLGANCFDEGKHGGAIEPGYIKSMENAFQFIQQFLNRKIDADWYLHLHSKTAEHFNGPQNGVEVGQDKIGCFRHDTQEISENCKLLLNDKVIDELCLENRTHLIGDYTSHQDSKCNTISYTYIAYRKSASNVEKIFNEFLSEYYDDIAKASNNDEKLLAIAKFIRRLEWLHPFCDGNTRTHIALLNKLLTENGFHPVVLDNQNAAILTTLQGWTAYIKDGMNRWEAILSKLNSP